MNNRQLRRKNVAEKDVGCKQELLWRRLKLGLLLLISALIFTLLLSIILPWAAKGALSRSFCQGLQAKTVVADIKTRSVWQLLRGKSESMSFTMEFDDNSLLALSSLQAQWGPSNVAFGLMRRGRGSERDAEPSTTQLYWDEVKLAAYLNRVQSEVLVSQVRIGSEQVEINGSMILNGGRHNFYLACLPRSDDLGQVIFKVSVWHIEGLVATQQLEERLCKVLSFEPDLSPLAWKVWAKQVVLSPGQMLVYGSSSCCH
ncbi:MAG: hypothetical protein FWG61_05415 [Firmicutes bacterium]|nr:hypothetical protein [Bacillota bacterium]